MDATSRHLIRAQVLSDEAFAPYGDIIKPRMSGEQFDRTHSYDPSKEQTHVKLVMTNGVPTLRIMHQRRRGLTFSKMARHRKSVSASAHFRAKSGIWHLQRQQMTIYARGLRILPPSVFLATVSSSCMSALGTQVRTSSIKNVYF